MSKASVVGSIRKQLRSSAHAGGGKPARLSASYWLNGVGDIGATGFVKYKYFESTDPPAFDVEWLSAVRLISHLSQNGQALGPWTKKVVKTSKGGPWQERLMFSSEADAVQARLMLG